MASNFIPENLLGFQNNISLVTQTFNYTTQCQHPQDTMNSNETQNSICVVSNSPTLDIPTKIFIVLYMAIFTIGIIGNLLVIFVIMRYRHLKTVTNLYILNLSIADSLFLIVLPLIVTLAITEHWIFGAFICKLFFTLDCVNKFMSAFIVTVMAGDRYLAACHPIKSLEYRKRKYASVLLLCIWLAAIFVMSPAIYYAGLQMTCSGHYSCTIVWPKSDGHYSNLFTAYTLVLAFAIPVICICTFYAMIITRLRRGGTGAQMPHRRHCQFRKATRLVTLVIIVFIACWLPHWCMQLMTILQATFNVTLLSFPLSFRLYQVFTALSYTNSMLNPMLYGFTNEYFREAFNNVVFCRTANAVVTGRQRGACGGTANICKHMEGASEKTTTRRECIPLKPPVGCINAESTNHSNLEI